MSRLILIAFLLILPVQKAMGDDLIIFVHNAFYEKNKEGQSHAKFGPYAFDAIVTALEQEAKVIAPVRNAPVAVDQAALRVVNMVKAALLRGTKPSEIKVIGASKGAYIAMIANQNLPTPDLKWVFVAGCSKRLDGAGFQLNGHVLSIYETSDTVARSCTKYKDMFQSTTRFEETLLLTGKDHGFQFTPDQSWIDPALKW